MPAEDLNKERSTWRGKGHCRYIKTVLLLPISGREMVSFLYQNLYKNPFCLEKNGNQEQSSTENMLVGVHKHGKLCLKIIRIGWYSANLKATRGQNI